MLLAANNFFGNDVLPPRIPVAMVLTLAFGYLLLLSTSFRGIIAAIPQHWLIGIQTFRVLGGVFIVRALALKWIRVIFRCWKNHTPYNETLYLHKNAMN